MGTPLSLQHSPRWIRRPLRGKVEDLEARSQWTNIREVGIAETTAIGNMERYIEQLLVTLLACETVKKMFVIEQEPRSLAPQPLPVQEARRFFLPAERQLQELHLKYCMLYLVKLRVMVDGKALLFSDQ
ncbi:hypothetical protein NDU88_002550 [Pleurodeles waltl]|uniref:Uncharacterized protein n=1 Tax=Pleurodeles waltl TaxID=8319 RepID=A0AAV7T2C9_PLEWA|nr:hypothetical protein NDU88_002550 [Pleurodeles waltl]